jgi:hypothetical protein
MTSYLGLLHTAADTLRASNIPHVLLQPEANGGVCQNCMFVVLPHLHCTAAVPNQLREQLLALVDAQLLPCEPSVPLRAAPVACKPRLVVIPSSCLLWTDTTEDGGAKAWPGKSQWTGFFRMELVRLMCAFPEAAILPVSEAVRFGTET